MFKFALFSRNEEEAKRVMELIAGMKELTSLSLMYIDMQIVEKFMDGISHLKKLSIYRPPSPFARFCEMLVKFGNLKEFTVRYKLKSYAKIDKLVIHDLEELRKRMPQCKFVYMVV